MKRTVLLLLFVTGAIGGSAWADSAATLKQQGDEQAKSGNSAQAMELYRRAIAADAGHLPAHDALTAQLLRAGQFAEVVRLLEELLRKAPKHADAWYSVAYAHRKLGRLDAAIAAYRQYAALRPERADPHYGLGLALRAKGQVALAAASFRRYAELEKDPTKQTWVAKARAFAAEAERLATPAPRQPPVAKAPASAATPKGAPVAKPARGSSAAHKSRGDALLKAGKLAEAVAAYRAAVASDAKNLPAVNELGSALFRLERYPEAAEAFRGAVTASPSFALGWYNLAYALRKAGKLEEAVAAYRRFSELKPADPDPYFGLGLTYLGLGKRAEARQAFGEYLKREKRPGQEKWLAEAKKHLAALEAGPAAPKPSAAAAPSAEGAKAAATDTPVGIPMPTMAESPPHTDSGRRREQAVVFARTGRCTAAIPIYRQTVAEDPFDTRAYDGLAFCAHRLGQHHQGILDLRTALRDNPEYETAWHHLGRLYRLSGQPQAAVGAYRRYLSKQPRHAEAQLELARALRASGLAAEAIEAYRAFLALDDHAELQPQRASARAELQALGGTPPAAPSAKQEGKEAGSGRASGPKGPASETGGKAPTPVASKLPADVMAKAMKEAGIGKRGGTSPGEGEGATEHTAVPVLSPAEKRAAAKEARRKAAEEKRAALEAKRTEEKRKREEARAARAAAAAAKKAEAERKREEAKQQREAETQRKAEEKQRRTDTQRMAQGAAETAVPAAAGGAAKGSGSGEKGQGGFSAALAEDLRRVPGGAKPEEGSAESPAAATALVALGDKQFASKRFLVALGLYRHAAQLDAKNVEALERAALAAVALQRLELAAELYGKLLKLEPKHRSAALGLRLTRAGGRPIRGVGRASLDNARRELQARRFAEADKALAQLPAAALGSEGYRLKAEAQLGLGRGEGALHEAGRALALDPSDVEALRLMGEAHRLLGNRSRALTYFRQYLAKPAGQRSSARRAAVSRAVAELAGR
ncbi:MAG: tetratricopeptide repeat protein [Deltaproteobacteria bacterium]|nr:tetratricopeptide repeat protein [Deltaproteobacteria bacterium]